MLPAVEKRISALVHGMQEDCSACAEEACSGYPPHSLPYQQTADDLSCPQQKRREGVNERRSPAHNCCKPQILVRYDNNSGKGRRYLAKQKKPRGSATPGKVSYRLLGKESKSDSLNNGNKCEIACYESIRGTADERLWRGGL